MTSVRGLYCCGETASTGLHGANRLGSNSLLEGLVLGKTAGAAAGAAAARKKTPVPRKIQAPSGKRKPQEIDLDDVQSSLRSAMWRNVGIIREAQGLGRALERVRFWSGYVFHRQFDSPRGWRVQNMLTLAELITRAALEREESRGVHFRSDFPQAKDPPRHTVARAPER